MKQMIFINTFVQLERFCFVYFISTEQQNWLHGWALRDLHTHPAYLASAARFKLLILLILQSGIRKARLLLARVISHAYSFTAWLVLAVATLWTQGNPQMCALIAIHKLSHLQGLTESSQKGGIGLWKTWPLGSWDFRGINFSHFQTPMSPTTWFSKFNLPSQILQEDGDRH